MKSPRTQRPIRPKDFTQNAKHMVDVAAGLAEERYPPAKSPQNLRGAGGRTKKGK